MYPYLLGFICPTTFISPSWEIRFFPGRSPVALGSLMPHKGINCTAQCPTNLLDTWSGGVCIGNWKCGRLEPRAGRHQTATKSSNLPSMWCWQAYHNFIIQRRDLGRWQKLWFSQPGECHDTCLDAFSTGLVWMPFPKASWELSFSPVGTVTAILTESKLLEINTSFPSLQGPEVLNSVTLLQAVCWIWTGRVPKQQGDCGDWSYFQWLLFFLLPLKLGALCCLVLLHIKSFCAPFSISESWGLFSPWQSWTSLSLFHKPEKGGQERLWGPDAKQSEHIKPNQLLRNSCFTHNMTKHHAKTHDWASFSSQLRGLSHPLLLGDSSDGMSSDCQDEKLCIYTEGETCDWGVWLGQKSRGRNPLQDLANLVRHDVPALEQLCYVEPRFQC